MADGWEVFPNALARVRDAGSATTPARPAGARACSWRGEPPEVVGWGGFKGPPRDGTVELGYAIAPAREGRGLATAAVRAMLRDAFADPEVRAMIAHTLPEPGPVPARAGEGGLHAEPAR